MLRQYCGYFGNVFGKVIAIHKTVKAFLWIKTRSREVFKSANGAAIY
jgi:hypothetical protein